MADNYLEKQYEAYKSGRPVFRKVNPSLDSLLLRLEDKDSLTDESYIIKQAQLDAVIRTARLLAESDGIDFFADEASSSIELSGWHDETALGQVMLAMRLKAAELHLRILFNTLDSNRIIAIFTYSKTVK